MSFNLNTKVNNLQAQISGIIAGSVTNPLSSTLNGNNQSITNVNTLSSVSGSPLNITAGASTVNFASEVNMVDTLTINNNTVHNGLVVKDGIGDTSCFVVDQSGNVGIKVNPSSALTTDFTVTGNSLISGNLTVGGTINASNVVNNITAGTGIIKTGTSTNPTLSTNLTAGTGISLIPGAGTTLGVSNTGVLTVTSGGAGSGISVTGTQNPVISTNLTAGTGISITSGIGSALQIASTVVIPPQGKLSRVGLVGNTTSPISGGTLGYQGLTLIAGAFFNDLVAGTSPDPNGVWVFDLNPVTIQLTGFLNSGVVNIGFGNSFDAGVYYNTVPNNASFGSPPTTNASGVRNGGCPPFIVKVSDLIATCPNMTTGATRLYFQNQSTDTLWVQTTPSIVICTYFPNGVE